MKYFAGSINKVTVSQHRLATIYFTNPKEQGTWKELCRFAKAVRKVRTKEKNRMDKYAK